jgi:glycosyltransferase involved in cell wall biosynthesis
MRITFFTPYYLPYISGLTLYPSRVLPLLPKKYTTTVLTFRHVSDLSSNEVVDGVAVKRMPYLFTVSKGFISPQSLFFFAKQVVRSDVLLVNLPSVEGLPAVLMAKLMGKKVISLFHCDITMNQSFWEKQLSLLIRKLVIIQLKMSHAILAYTQDYIASLSYASVFADKTIYSLPPVAHEIADHEYFSYLKSIKKNNYWIGFVGRIAREKGIEVAIEAMKKMPRTSVLVLVGPKGDEVAGESQYYEFIQSLLKKSGIKYLLLPTLRGEKLSSLYQALDVLILPSINQTEAFGMVQAEAMLQGTPVIASDLPGVRCTINKTQAGLLVETGSVTSLIQALQKVSLASWSRKEIKQKAQAIFSTTAVTARMIEAIGTIEKP